MTSLTLQHGYSIHNINGHYEIFSPYKNFIGSADTYREALHELDFYLVKSATQNQPFKATIQKGKTIMNNSTIQNVHPVTDRTIAYLKQHAPKSADMAIAFCIWEILHHSQATKAQRLFAARQKVYPHLIILLQEHKIHSSLQNLTPRQKKMVNYLYLNNPIR